MPVKKKTPPIIPKKDIKLRSTPLQNNDVDNVIQIPHLIARKEDPVQPQKTMTTTTTITTTPPPAARVQPKSLAAFMNDLNINTHFEIPKRNIHEPKVIKYDDIEKPVVNTYRNNNTLENPLKKKPVPPPKPRGLTHSTTVDSIVSHSRHLMIPLPGLVNKHVTFNSTPSVKQSEEPSKIRHLNKGRSRGPRRRPSPAIAREPQQGASRNKVRGPSLKPKPSHLRSQFAV